jgi:regulator of replication initiation timing
MTGFFSTNKPMPKVEVDATTPELRINTDKSFELVVDGAKKYAPINLAIDLAAIAKINGGINVSILFSHINTQLKTLRKDATDMLQISSLFKNDDRLLDISEVIYAAKNRIPLTAKVNVMKPENLQEVKELHESRAKAIAENTALKQEYQDICKQLEQLQQTKMQFEQEKIPTSDKRVAMTQQQLVAAIEKIKPGFLNGNGVARDKANQMAHQISNDAALNMHHSPALSA